MPSRGKVVDFETAARLVPGDAVIAQVKRLAARGSLDAHRVTLIAERGVFRDRAGDDRLTLIEVAPGIDPERDVTRLVELPLPISPELKVMDPGLFRPELIGPRLGKR